MSACSGSSSMITDSILTIISAAGMLLGITAKFNPFFSKAVSESLRDLEYGLTCQLALSECGVFVDETTACFSCRSISNFCCCLSLVKTRLLFLICSSILLASSGETFDNIPCGEF